MHGACVRAPRVSGRGADGAKAHRFCLAEKCSFILGEALIGTKWGDKGQR
ncbi:unnamed protein product [Chondrus crispus]|uniref:Uncharacterized protein n=1 Tax=Chondrus crispus TaxID=2769 RepID=R7QC65_CHOCR|nr:unnamed protein product [Chondrus crispus]CDF36092.1 unnamed protein product [Chondrus crispus]|eukprot:XP_005715911.1 unnamed protein product [Chondrus crispus]